MAIERVSRTDDPRLADFVAIRERDLVGRRGSFIAEGEIVVRILLQQSKYRTRALLAADKLVDRIAPLVPAAVPIYVGSTELLSSIVGFPLHRGLLAVGDRGSPADTESLIASARKLVVLEGIANHDNVGGIFRNAAAFGADAVLLDDLTCDPLYRKSIRVSAGGALLVPFARYLNGQSLRDALGRLGFCSLALTPRGDTRPLSEFTPGARTALWLGAEGTGLAETTLAGCDARVAIPMQDGFDSLNVAVACGIALYALASVSKRL